MISCVNICSLFFIPQNKKGIQGKKKAFTDTKRTILRQSVFPKTEKIKGFSTYNWVKSFAFVAIREPLSAFLRKRGKEEKMI